MTYSGLSRHPYPLYPWQEKALQRYQGQTNIFLNAGMGRGKTRVAITLLRLKCIELKEIPPTIIVAPLSTLYNWQKELKELCEPEIPKAAIILSGDNKKKLKDFDKNLKSVRVFITNHAALRCKPLLDRFKALRPKLFIVDESQRFKGRDTQQTKAATELADQSETKILMSGTPILNKAWDIYAQMRLFGPGEYFSANYYSFMGRYFRDENAKWKNKPHYFPKWSLREETADEFRDIVKSVVMTIDPEDDIKMPKIIKKPRYLPLSENIQTQYEELKEHFLTTIADETLSVDMALTKALRLLQLCAGVAKTDDGEEHFFETNKVQALRDVLEATDEKVIIWTPWVRTYQPIFNLCSELKLNPTIITSEVSDPQKRQDAIDAFQCKSDRRVLIANPASMGVGVNLQAASVMVYFSKTYNLEHDVQSEARCVRGNSPFEHVTRVDLITAGTIEEDVETALSAKQSLGDYILRKRNSFLGVI